MQQYSMADLKAMGQAEFDSLAKHTNSVLKAHWQNHAKVLIEGHRRAEDKFKYGQWLTETYGDDLSVEEAYRIRSTYLQFVDTPLAHLPMTTLTSLLSADEEVLAAVRERVDSGKPATREWVRKARKTLEEATSQGKSGAVKQELLDALADRVKNKVKPKAVVDKPEMAPTVTDDKPVVVQGWGRAKDISDSVQALSEVRRVFTGNDEISKQVSVLLELITAATAEPVAA